MAFSRMAKKAPPAEDPEAAAWQAQLAKEQEERSRSDDRTQAKSKASVEDARWKETHQMYNNNLAESAARNDLQQQDEDKARQIRIERSKQEAAKRAMGSSGGFGAAAGAKGGAFGSGGGRSDFAWKKPAATSGYGSRSGPPAEMADLPSHDDCELAVSAMISRTLQGMKEGLRQLALPDYPLKFVPGRELALCGHDVREVVNEMIHAWMTDEKDEFYNVLLRVKSIVANPILTEEEMALLQHKDAWDKNDSADGVLYTQKGAAGISPPKLVASRIDDDSEDEVIDLSIAAPARQEAPRPSTHSFAKAVPVAPSGDGDDHYALLGIASTATLQEIRLKFRQLVVTEHPEKGGDPKKFAKLNKAYGVLSDQEKRRQFDETRR